MPSPRLGWLDALRAVAVLLVIYAHLSRYVFTGLRALTAEWLNAGVAGVMLFFLVSGYIIPASLERHGSLRAFWTSRIFRLYPMYLVAIAAMVLFDGASLSVSDALSHGTMLPFLLGTPLITAVLWTLTYEMAFYLLVTALFTFRLHRWDGIVSAGLAGLALLTAPLSLRYAVPAPVVLLLLLVGLTAVVSGRRAVVIAGGLLLGGLTATLLAIGQDPAHAWDGLLILSVMFLGTTIYRADVGQTSWWQPAIVGSVVAVALIINWFRQLASLNGLIFRYEARALITLAVFGGAFAVGMLTRRRPAPRWLARIGVLSYSVYLVHYVLIELFHGFLSDGPLPDAVRATAYLTAVLGLSWLTHRYVELPAQRLGKRLTTAPAPATTAPRPSVPSER
ncbi:acyltransferase [Actinoplanes sp. NPDC051851]|uniref:acyltransferase family protein n=1 Tax=Actinoplanes sp. NPDC051851 TaxID=3154753 RepID=UPI003424EA25